MSPVWGLIGVLIVCLSQAFALPLINRLDLSADRLLVTRGVVTLTLACLAIVITSNPIIVPNWWLVPAAISFGFAALCLFKAVKAWGAARSLVVVAVTPVLNLLFHRSDLNPLTVAVLAAMLIGVTLALDPWRKGSGFSASGLIWSLVGTGLNALFYEASAGVHLEPAVPTITVCFWQGLAVAVVALVRLGYAQAQGRGEKKKLPSILLLIAFGAIGGFGYFVGNQMAFANLPTVACSILLQFEVVTVAAAEALIDPTKRLSARQWLGAVITLAATAYLAIQLAQAAGG